MFYFFRLSSATKIKQGEKLTPTKFWIIQYRKSSRYLIFAGAWDWQKYLKTKIFSTYSTLLCALHKVALTLCSWQWISVVVRSRSWAQNIQGYGSFLFPFLLSSLRYYFPTWRCGEHAEHLSTGAGSDIVLLCLLALSCPLHWKLQSIHEVGQAEGVLPSRVALWCLFPHSGDHYNVHYCMEWYPKVFGFGRSNSTPGVDGWFPDHYVCHDVLLLCGVYHWWVLPGSVSLSRWICFRGSYRRIKAR